MNMPNAVCQLINVSLLWSQRHKLKKKMWKTHNQKGISNFLDSAFIYLAIYLTFLHIIIANALW